MLATYKKTLVNNQNNYPSFTGQKNLNKQVNKFYQIYNIF